MRDPIIRRPNRAFRAAGLRLLLALLSVPKLINAPYRDMAQAARVALGTVPLVLASLEDIGYIITVRGARRFANVEKLIAEWSQAYARLALGRDVLGRFASQSPNWWRTAKGHLGETLWGGEVAAAVLTRQLVPERYSLYAEAMPAKLLTSIRARKDEQGDIIIHHRFWHFEHPLQTSHHVVPPLLIYAELLANGDARSSDAAKRIYDEFVVRFVEE